MNKESISTLLEPQYRGLQVLLRQRTRDPQLAADLLNDAIVVTLEHLEAGRIANPEAIGGYVFQVALNLLRNHRRKIADRVDKRAEVDDSLASEISPEEFEWAALVREVINELPVRRDREILTRFYLDEEEKEGICRDVGVSVLHFDKIIFRARQRMKTLLEARGFKPDDLLYVLILGTLFTIAAYLTTLARSPHEVNTRVMTLRH